MKAFMMVGPPAAGKTSYVQTLRQKHPDLRHIEGDKIREQLLADGAEENYYIALQDGIESAVADACGNGNSVVIDGCNYRGDYRGEMVTLLRSYGYDRVDAIVMLPSLKTCLSRNARRKRVVPDYVVRQMHKDVRASLGVIESENFDSVTFIH